MEDREFDVCIVAEGHVKGPLSITVRPPYKFSVFRTSVKHEFGLEPLAMDSLEFRRVGEELLRADDKAAAALFAASTAVIGPPNFTGDEKYIVGKIMAPTGGAAAAMTGGAGAAAATATAGGAGASEPAQKKARLSIEECSDVWARELVDAPMPNLVTAADVRAFLEQPLPSPLIVDAGRSALVSASATLLPGGDCVLPLQARDGGRVMMKLETLIDSGFVYPASCTTEETIASLADILTGRVWRALSGMLAAFSFEDSRNSIDRSGATKPLLRPDYCAWANDSLVFKAEHKAARGDLGLAMGEIASKMTGGWKPVAMRGLPFLPCFAAGGEFIQFAIVYPGPGASAAVESVSDSINMMEPVGRLRILRIAFTLFRVIAWLRRRLPAGFLRLYEKLARGDRGEFVVINEDHVQKRAFITAPAGMYELLANGSIPSAIRVEPFARVDGGLSKLIMRPIGIARMPLSEDELRAALDCVLRALQALHGYGFVHRDVRWPNLLSDGGTGWLLVDFESAGEAGQPVPTGLVKSALLSPESRIDGAAYEPRDDVWQVGKLLSSCTLPRRLRQSRSGPR